MPAVKIYGKLWWYFMTDWLGTFVWDSGRIEYELCTEYSRSRTNQTASLCTKSWNRCKLLQWITEFWILQLIKLIVKILNPLKKIILSHWVGVHVFVMLNIRLTLKNRDIILLTFYKITKHIFDVVMMLVSSCEWLCRYDGHDTHFKIELTSLKSFVKASGRPICFVC